MPSVYQHRSAIVERHEENGLGQINLLGVLFVQCRISLSDMHYVNAAVAGVELHRRAGCLLDKPVPLGVVPVPLRAGCVGEGEDLIAQVQFMVDYIKKRATGKVHFTLNTHNNTQVPAMISPPLFDWVIENLLKNALDAMEGKGDINIDISQQEKEIFIDVADTGKGITKYNLQKVFKPGFTTKKRGWGLGLSLSKRIIEQYHKGELFVKNSEPGKGTTFRIVLKKMANKQA